MLFAKYQKEIIPELKKELKIDNLLALPRVTKVVINMRVTEGKEDRGVITAAAEDVKLLTGQNPKVCRAAQAVSSFKLKKGDPIGLKVTLRGRRMYQFLDRLFYLVLPRLRDFRGISAKQFDQGGNFNIGLKEQTVFPEVDIDKVSKNRGLQITIVTKSKNNEEAKVLLRLLGLPFAKEEGDDNGI